MISLEWYLTSAAYAVVLALLLLGVCAPLLGILQQEGYAGRALLRWHYRKGNELKKRIFLLTLVAVLLTALLSLSFSFAGGGVSALVAFLGYAGACALYIYAFRYSLKVKFRHTPRAMRLSVALYLFLAGVSYGIFLGMEALAAAIGHPLAFTLLRAVPPALLPLALPGSVAVCNLLMKAYEVPHTRKFLKRAAAALRQSACLKVGITGSFAKTSVKHYCYELLREKYRVKMTPASYNTPAGIAKFVNAEGLDCDVFLAEMGARKRGDIAELCDMVCPSFAIVTGICPQHLETFGSLEAIKAEKGVLARRAENVVLGRTAADLSKEGALLEGRDFGAENVELDPCGTAFDLVLGGERTRVRCGLLGRHAAEDVALASALAFMLGMTPAEIAARIPQLRPVKHRLERLDENGVTILDDSYNSNVMGARNAVEVLKLFSGKRYVVTPGLVELGELEERANGELGAEFVGLDGVILVGETLVLAVRSGYLAAGGAEETLRVVPTLQKAQALLSAELSEGDCVLFLNDLPDKYL